MYMSHEVNNIMKRGFAEFGPNFFALKAVGRYESNDIVMGIMKESIKMGVKTGWKETAKASLLSKMNTIANVGGAKIVGAITNNDLTVPLLGEATYKRYTGIDMFDYGLTTTIYNSDTFDDSNTVTSGPAFIEFLKTHGTINSDMNGFSTQFKNFFAAPIDALEKLDKVSDLINDVPANFNTKQAKDVIGAMKRFIHEEGVIAGFLKDELTRKFTLPKLKVNNKDDKADVITIYIGSTVLCKLNSYGTQLAKLEKMTPSQEDLNWNQSVYDLFLKYISQTKLIVNEGELIDKIFSSIDISPDEAVKQATLFKVNDLISKYDNKLQDKKRVILEGVFAVKEEVKKSKFTAAADILIYGRNKKFGEFDHHISPCILYFAFAGMIFKEPVLIKNWSVNTNTWDFGSEISLSFERARIDTYKEFVDGSEDDSTGGVTVLKYV